VESQPYLEMPQQTWPKFVIKKKKQSLESANRWLGVVGVAVSNNKSIIYLVVEPTHLKKYACRIGSFPPFLRVKMPKNIGSFTQPSVVIGIPPSNRDNIAGWGYHLATIWRHQNESSW